MVIKNINRLVTIYHALGRHVTVKSIKEHGLLSYRELFKRRLTPTQVNPNELDQRLLSDSYDNIYFDPIWMMSSNTSKNRVGYQVDPNTTYVYNQEFRADDNPHKYNSSRVLLATYLANVAKSKKMKKNAPAGQVVIFDPFTSEPFYVDVNDERNDDAELLYFDRNKLQTRHYLYLAEITIKKPCIEPKNLIFFDDNYKAPENQILY